ncbi:hypothetical protein [Arthrobacter sp. ISL-5]|uniref:hypothetical protein n=1 Tax=Arthrobacter sp. ISL-5 TaxID=2819111 RepID=UPI001BE4EA0B|nr:hypothetical protein [Arthrobacter sp. ISL-5]
MSCDNIQGNGDVARKMFTAFANLKDPELGDWVAENVPFPNSMVDRITPVTTDADRAAIADEFGIEEGWQVVCEPFEQWVLEDPIDVVDRLKEPLMAAASRQREEPLAFGSNREVFGNLIDDQRFVDAYSAALDDLHSGGPGLPWKPSERGIPAVVDVVEEAVCCCS